MVVKMDLKEEGGSVEADDRKHDLEDGECSPKLPPLTTDAEELLKQPVGMSQRPDDKILNPLRPKRKNLIGYRVDLNDKEKENWQEFLDLDRKTFPEPRKQGRQLFVDDIPIQNHNNYPFVRDLLKFVQVYSDMIFTKAGVHNGIEMNEITAVKYAWNEYFYVHYVDFLGREKGIEHVIEGGPYRATVQTLGNKCRTLVELCRPLDWLFRFVEEKEANPDKAWSEFLEARRKDLTEVRKKDADGDEKDGLICRTPLLDYDYYCPKKEFKFFCF